MGNAHDPWVVQATIGRLEVLDFLDIHPFQYSLGVASYKGNGHRVVIPEARQYRHNERRAGSSLMVPQVCTNSWGSLDYPVQFAWHV
jgi:hypothetical protein